MSVVLWTFFYAVNRTEQARTNNDALKVMFFFLLKLRALSIAMHFMVNIFVLELGN